METFQLTVGAAAAYERHLVPRLFEPLADRLIAAAAPSSTDHVLDVACGTGVVARRAARVAAGVTGVDINAGMIEQARRTEPAVAWRVGDAQTIDLASESYDIAYCQQGLQFMADPLAALRSIARCLRPGGRLALALWRPIEQAPGFAALAAALDSHVGTQAADVLRGPFRLADPATVAGLATAAGLDRVRVLNHCHSVTFGSVAEFVQAEIECTPLAQQVSGWPAGATAAVTMDTTQRLQPYTADDGLMFPMGAYLVTATR